MKIVQCLLRGEHGSMLCWLREEERLKVDSILLLDGDTRMWTVESISHPHEFGIIQTLEEPTML